MTPNPPGRPFMRIRTHTEHVYEPDQHWKANLKQNIDRILAEALQETKALQEEYIRTIDAQSKKDASLREFRRMVNIVKKLAKDAYEIELERERLEMRQRSANDVHERMLSEIRERGENNVLVVILRSERAHTNASTTGTTRTSPDELSTRSSQSASPGSSLLVETPSDVSGWESPPAQRMENTATGKGRADLHPSGPAPHPRKGSAANSSPVPRQTGSVGYSPFIPNIDLSTPPISFLPSTSPIAMHGQLPNHFQYGLPTWRSSRYSMNIQPLAETETAWRFWGRIPSSISSYSLGSVSSATASVQGEDFEGQRSSGSSSGSDDSGFGTTSESDSGFDEPESDGGDSTGKGKERTNLGESSEMESAKRDKDLSDSEEKITKRTHSDEEEQEQITREAPSNHPNPRTAHNNPHGQDDEDVQNWKEERERDKRESKLSNRLYGEAEAAKQGAEDRKNLEKPRREADGERHEVIQAGSSRTAGEERASTQKVLSHSGQQVVNADTVLTQLKLILDNKEEYRKLLAQRGELAQSLLDLLQTLSDYPSVNRRLRSKIFDAMIRLSRSAKLHPSCLSLSNVEKVGDHPMAGGGFGDIWRASIAGHKACMKVVRIFDRANIDKFLKEFLKEAILWRQLDHPNVLPFLGLYFLDDTQERICLISPMMDNGTVIQYLENQADESIDRAVLVYDVSCGLSYLHEMKVVHGDLKGANILVTPSGRASITDFGLSVVADSELLKWTSLSTSNRTAGTARWLAPECLNGDPVSYSSDVYAFAFVSYEIFTGRIPFHELSQEPAVMLKVLTGKRPKRPQSPHLNDDIWAIMQECWHQEAGFRPAANVLPQRLEDIASQEREIEPAGGWDMSLPSGLWSSVHHPELCPEGSDLEAFLFGPDSM
ncbi:hypothetical protein D9758_008757 [Tetrapyrgos nigripes]|uniref:Protein kinase domain-containing protein n=1 Tax=Tetrapyrgos nigripes TaxID=182062 RepID=A0A8H5D5G9_9AGAR|nr:hypothetical protein D9758_008757 [Tetrapyrgos nigripes]